MILKYFNDFLARNYQAATFQRLKELKIFKPLWSEKHINLNFPIGLNNNTPNSSTVINSQQINNPQVSSTNMQMMANNNNSSLISGNVSSLNLNLSVANIYLITDEMALLMKRSFKMSPFKPASNGLPGSVNNVNNFNGSTTQTQTINVGGQVHASPVLMRQNSTSSSDNNNNNTTGKLKRRN